MDNCCSVSYMGACSNLLFSACSLCTSGVTFPPTTIALDNGRQSFRDIFWDGQCSRAMVVSGTRSLQLQQEWRPHKTMEDDHTSMIFCKIGIATCCNMAVQRQLCIYSPPKPCWEKNTPTWRQPFNKNHSKTSKSPGSTQPDFGFPLAGHLPFDRLYRSLKTKSVLYYIFPFGYSLEQPIIQKVIYSFLGCLYIHPKGWMVYSF